MTHTQMIGAVVLAFIVSNAISLVSLVMSRIEAASLRLELSGMRSDLKGLQAAVSALRSELPGDSERLGPVAGDAGIAG